MGPDRLKHLKRLCADESGVAVIEYAVIISLVAMAISASLGALGGEVSSTIGDVDAEFQQLNGSDAGSAGDPAPTTNPWRLDEDD